MKLLSESYSKMKRQSAYLLFIISPKTKCYHSLKEVRYPIGVHVGQTSGVQSFLCFVFKVENRFRSVFQNPQKLNLCLIQ